MRRKQPVHSHGDGVKLFKKGEKDSGLGFNIQQAEFLRKRLPELQKKDRNLSVRIERLKKRIGPSQE